MREETEIIEKDGVQYEVIRRIAKQKNNKIIVNNWDLTEFEKWYDTEYCIKAVEKDGEALQYIKEQNEAICTKAVEQNGYALQYVKDQTEAICLKAVEKDGEALRYVNKKIWLK